jgi:hypothetical protein
MCNEIDIRENLDSVAKQTASISFQEIEQCFLRAQAPYQLKDILAFNAIYRRSYSRLTRWEKRRVENEFVEALIHGVEAPKLKSKIFGVV